MHNCHELTSQSFLKRTVLSLGNVGWLLTPSLCFHPGKPQMYLVAREESLHQSEPSKILIIVGPDA